MRLRPLAWLAALLCAAGCGDDDDSPAPREAQPEPEAVAPAELFPLTPGDRWRTETATGTAHNVGVTGSEPSGIAVIHGTGHALAERYRASDEEVALVDPEGTVLVPLLRAPLRAGEDWEYALRDRDVRVPCRAEVRTVGVAERVAGAALSDCVEIVRRCEHPERQPFPSETTHTTEELYCPGLGRVREIGTFDPPPPELLMPARRARRVVGWRVDGAPPMPEPVSFGCESFLLLPSDVQAACGAAVQPAEPVAGEPGDERCAYRFRSPGGTIEIVAERRGAPLEEGDVDEALRGEEGDGTVRSHEGVRVLTGERLRFGLRHGRVLVRVSADPTACPEESALRLAPLLRSLIAR